VFRPRSLAHLLPELVRTLLGGRVTVRFPFTPLELPSHYRGKVVAVHPELCGGCGRCVRDCPAFALELEWEGQDQFRLIHYRDRCAYCGQCVDTCKRGAIVLISEFVQATSQRDTFAQVMARRETGTQQHY
jgi:formate hydrogenlyase subunit 6/NADH:ubiquinone oxidoreductase subunit I